MRTSTTTPTYRIAVIGLGPRGLGALEALALLSVDLSVEFQIDIFDVSDWPGAGPNFSPDQSELCILNIPIRALDIAPPREISGDLDAFESWGDNSDEPDRFPSRAELGRYLSARFESLKSNGNLFVELRRKRVVKVLRHESAWELETAAESYGPYEDVLVTLGQPKTEPDPQLARWQNHSVQNTLPLHQAYPANGLLSAAQAWSQKSVAIRGLGLSTLDVLRLLTTGLGGSFRGGRYHPSGKEPLRIFPFSLDGQPPVAKPATGELDALFDPEVAETQRFSEALALSLTQKPERALEVIRDALLAPTLRILQLLGGVETKQDVIDWLAAECENPGSQESRSALDALASGIEVARGRTAPPCGYVIGQLWRKWQNELRSGFNPSTLASQTAAAIIAFDEGLKRYSYGPPVSAAEELLILVRAGMVDMRVVDDPDICLNDAGWQLVAGDITSQVSVMIDAVIPSPSLAGISEPLLSELRDSGKVRAVTEGLGVFTAADGRLARNDGEYQKGLCLLGRLALGSVIAADSLHDCFGESGSRWAAAVVARAVTR